MENKVIIGLSTSSGFIASAIKWFTRSKASHNWFRVYDDCLKTWLVFTSNASGFEIEIYDKYKKKNTILAEYQCSHNLMPGVPGMAKRVGEKYDIPSLFGMGWVMIMWNLLKVKIRNPFRNPRKMICSEAVALLLQKARTPDFNGWDPETTSPQMLWDYMITSKYFSEIYAS